MLPQAETILFYDGDCALCHGVVKRLLRWDGEGKLNYAPLQGVTAERLRAASVPVPHGLSEIVLWHQGELYSGQAAVQQALILLGGTSRALGKLMNIFPRRLRVWGYRLVAGSRYRVWGKTESLCPLIPTELRSRFLD